MRRVSLRGDASSRRRGDLRLTHPHGHLRAVEHHRPLAVRIAVQSAMAMVDVIRADEMLRLDVCADADADCDGIVLDLSRNRSRKFCSTPCGNQAAVAAYRARQA